MRPKNAHTSRNGVSARGASGIRTESALANVPVAGMVIGELEGGGFGDLTAALLQSQTKGGTTWSGDEVEGLGPHAPTWGMDAPRLHPRSPHKGARMRPKMPTHV
jgi:hypothetical protein